MPRLDAAQKLQQSLLEQGAEVADVRMAFLLFMAIKVLDAKIFPAHHAKIAFRVHRGVKGMASYSRQRSSPRNIYFISVHGLHNCVQRKAREAAILFGLKSPSNLETLYAVAAHEVRHRLQVFPGLKRFSSDCRKTGNEKFDQILIAVRSILSSFRKDLEKEGRSARYVRERTGVREFDAMVVQYYSHILTHASRDATPFMAACESLRMQS